VWVDNEKLVPGTPIWEEEIEKAIVNAGSIVVLLSPDSKKSPWVRREIGYAEDNGKRIFPILIAGDEKNTIPIRLTTHQRIDLRQNEELGLKSLNIALSLHIENLEAQERRAREETERLAHEKAEQEAAEKASKEKAEREAAEKAAKEKAEREVAEKAAREKVERAAAEKAAKEKAERDATYKDSQNQVKQEEVITTFYPRWVNVFWIAVGWALGSVIFSVIGNTIDITILTAVDLGIGAINGAISGTIVGIATALVLKKEEIITEKKSIVWVTLGLTISWAIIEVVNLAFIHSSNNGIGFFIIAIYPIYLISSLAIDGFIIAYVLRREEIITDKKNMFWIIFGWVIGSLISGVIQITIFSIINFSAMENPEIFTSIFGLFTGAINGAIGGVITVYVVRKSWHNNIRE